MSKTTEELQDYIKMMRSEKGFNSSFRTLIDKYDEEVIEFRNEMISLYSNKSNKDFKNELADVFIILIAICNKYDIDMYDIIDDKINSWFDK